MWFKNIQVYKLINAKRMGEEEIEEKLKAEQFKPCNKHDLFKSGWDFILEDDAEEKLTRKVEDCFFFKLKKEEKIIPSGVVKDIYKEKEKEYRANNDDKKPSKDDKAAIKDDIIMKLAATAFVSSKYLDGYIDYKNNLLIVDCGSTGKAEEFISELRTTFGTMEATLLESENDVASTLSSWLTNGSHPSEFDIGFNCDFKDDDGGVISIKKHDVDVKEVTQHLDKNKNVVKLELVWRKRIRFSLTDKFEIKSIKPEDIVKEDVKESLDNGIDDYAIFSANMVMMTGEIAELVFDLSECI